MTKTESEIVLTSPATDDSMGTHVGQYVVSLDVSSSILTTIEFDVSIDSPDCQDLAMVIPPNLSNMAIALGDTTDQRQTVLSLEDTHGLWDMGYCHAAISITLNDMEVSFLTLETADDIYNQDSQIVLTTPIDNTLIGA